MAAYYGVILLMPLGMVAVAGLWGAVLATGLALLPVWGLHRALSARRSLEVSPTLASERGLS
jgi:hypothetical protein